MDFSSHSLYGGAITADIPNSFRDVSTFRPEIPDNQEVFVSDLEELLVIEILEPLDHLTDKTAAPWYLLNLFEESGGILSESTTTPNTVLPTVQSLHDSNHAVFLVDGKSNLQYSALVLLRLKDHNCDILFSISKSEANNDEIQTWKAFLARIISSFHLLDANLFT